ncbi:MAG: hypothetical protein PHF31_05840 [Methylobacter sp.]|nr:hypothetical protein [Methylobacter sp.]
MNKPFQRPSSKSNAQVGSDFEIVAQEYFAKQGIKLQRSLKIKVGVRNCKPKDHAFDLGCKEEKILVECKSHKWTAPGDNIPSAKLTVWNEAMYYFLAAPENYRKIMFVLRDYNEKRGETLADYYLRTYRHLIPDEVEFWEFNEPNQTAVQLFIAVDKL